MYVVQVFSKPIVIYIMNSRAVWGMSIRNLTSLSLDLASATDLKCIQTPHSLCCDFRGNKQLVGQAAELKFESKFEPLQV